ncbi:hypothetical protein PINS_up000782 [Pythium insidiosum]|nr:hypothetical protein PINS_up000782 [Pythium insidiosum]
MEASHFEERWGNLCECIVDMVEVMCPPLKRYLSWNIGDIGPLFVEDECQSCSDDVSAPQHIEDLIKERGDFIHLAASAA